MLNGRGDADINEDLEYVNRVSLDTERAAARDVTDLPVLGSSRGLLGRGFLPASES